MRRTIEAQPVSDLGKDGSGDEARRQHYLLLEQLTEDSSRKQHGSSSPVRLNLHGQGHQLRPARVAELFKNAAEVCFHRVR